MIFFLAMAFMTGLFNFIVPLQIGARDVAYPFLNNLSFWMTAVAFMLVNVSLFIGEFSQCGWLAYPPLSEMQFSLAWVLTTISGRSRSLVLARC